MIADAFFDMVEALISAVFLLFPTWTPDLGALPVVNMFLPVDVFLGALGVMLAFAQAGLVVWGIMKAVNLLRGSGA